jgi:hypothetical protein
MTLKRVGSIAEADAHDSREAALVEAPGELVGRLLVLLDTASGQGNARRRKLAKALLKTAAAR